MKLRAVRSCSKRTVVSNPSLWIVAPPTLKDELMPRYAELIYNGFWFSPEREMLQALIDTSQEHVTGTVRLKLYKGLARNVGRWSDHSLYSEAHVTFEDDAGAYDQKDAAGFIQLNALRLKLLAARERRLK